MLYSLFPVIFPHFRSLYYCFLQQGWQFYTRGKFEKWCINLSVFQSRHLNVSTWPEVLLSCTLAKNKLDSYCAYWISTWFGSLSTMSADNRQWTSVLSRRSNTVLNWTFWILATHTGHRESSWPMKTSRNICSWCEAREKVRDWVTAGYGFTFSDSMTKWRECF